MSTVKDPNTGKSVSTHQGDLLGVGEAQGRLSLAPFLSDGRRVEWYRPTGDCQRTPGQYPSWNIRPLCGSTKLTASRCVAYAHTHAVCQRDFRPFEEPYHAVINFQSCDVDFSLSIFRRRWMTYLKVLALRISCRAPDWQLSSVAQVCASALSSLSTLERLEIDDGRPYWEDDIENTQ